jgi:heptaprenyl diphosphate synthase
MRRFRDKFALKEHLRSTRPDLRMNRSFRVASVADVFSPPARALERFVLKPNDGFGNRDIGVFAAATPGAEIERFLAARSGRPFLLEEYVGGTEYFVNGQIDGRGEVLVLAVFEYRRVFANGREGIDLETRLVHRDETVFATAAAYAQEVMAGTGLRRSPFHLELKIDERGPCLIEVGARLAGNGNAIFCDQIHGGRVELFALAIRHYLDPGAPLPAIDWNAYDTNHAEYAHGIATRKEIIVQLEGVAAVEALPSFCGWARKPAVGDRVNVTTDALSMPWSVTLMNRSPEGLAADAAAARQLIHWNRSAGPVRRSAARVVAAARSRYDGFPTRMASSGDPRLKRALEDLAGVVGQASKNLARRVSSLAGRLQREGVGRSPEPLPPPLGPRRLREAEVVLRWVRDYLGEPHPQLGRKGQICPFVKRSLAEDRLAIVFHDEVDGSSAAQIRDLVLRHSDAFEHQHRRDDTLPALFLVFSSMPDDRLPLLDRLHDELKTDLMRRGLMITSLHKFCERRALSNPDFPVTQSPFAGFAIRNMVAQDIVFVGHNQPAFAAYSERFAALFEQGKVSNEFGYVDRFREAQARFKGK